MSFDIWEIACFKLVEKLLDKVLWTDRQTDGQTDRQTNGQMNCLNDRQIRQDMFWYQILSFSQIRYHFKTAANKIV